MSQRQRSADQHLKWRLPHIVDFIVDDPSHLSHHLAPPVKHGPQDFRGHDQARGTGVDGDVARHQANVTELLLRYVPVDRGSRGRLSKYLCIQ